MAPPVSREALLHVVKNLPAAPRILAQLGRLLLDPNADRSDIIELLRHDPALTTRVIRVSNSVMYGSGERAASLEEALLRVGFNEVYRMVGMSAVAGVVDDTLRSYGISGALFRENSLFTALVMEELGPLVAIDARAAYTAGLLRSIGKVAIDRLMPGPVNASTYEARGHGRPVDQWEQEWVGIDNCTAAGAVLEEWRFPQHTVRAIRDHYRPTPYSPPMAYLLNFASGLAEQAGYALPGEQGFWDMTASKSEHTGIGVDDLRLALNVASDRFERAKEAVS